MCLRSLPFTFSDHSPAERAEPAQPAESAVFPGWSEPDSNPLPQPSEENLFTVALAEDVVGVDQAVATIKVLDATRKLAVSQLPQAQQCRDQGAALPDL